MAMLFEYILDYSTMFSKILYYWMSADVVNYFGDTIYFRPISGLEICYTETQKDRNKLIIYQGSNR